MLCRETGLLPDKHMNDYCLKDEAGGLLHCCFLRGCVTQSDALFLTKEKSEKDISCLFGA